MKIQRVQLENGLSSWIVLNHQGLPIPPILSFLRYLQHVEKSPHTIRNYANHLKLYWEFLELHQFQWQTIQLHQLGQFVYWLRQQKPNVISLPQGDTQRTASTVNCILSVLSAFYRYHKQLGHTAIELTQAAHIKHFPYRSLLHHLHRQKPIQKKILGLKVAKTIPKTLSREQIKALIGYCQSKRDVFLVSLLAESGLRIGQALCLQHQDIRSFDNEIDIIPRQDPTHPERNKTQTPYTVHVSSALMQVYSHYVIDSPWAETNAYVFLKHKDEPIPMDYSCVRSLFKRLSKKMAFQLTPHQLRHSHATELIRGGWDAAWVQRRLGHRSVQTTLNTYVHLNEQDLKLAYQRYLNQQETGETP